MTDGEASIASRVDVRGSFCPLPIIETAKAMKEIAVGELLQVVGSDRGMRTDFPAWCKATGNELMDLREEGDMISVLIRRLR